MKYSILLIIFCFTLGASAQTLQSVTSNGNTTSNGIAINTGAEALSLIGNSYLSFKDGANTLRKGYIQHDGNNLVFSADVGHIRLMNKVAMGLAAPYYGSMIHVKAPDPSPWSILAEASVNRRVIGMSHTGAEGVVAVSYLDDAGFTPLQFWTSNLPRLTIATDGNVGIGGGIPSAKLHVKADANTSGGAPGNSQFIIGGTTHPEKRLSLAYNTSFNYAEIQSQVYAGSYSSINLNPNGGNVGIGTIAPDSKLSVNGNIRAKEIKVETANWPDYVFKKDYLLPSLAETEKHIKEKGHLPGIPSAKEAETNGIDLGDMNAKLLKKIEELTLHVIEQSKKVTSLEEIIRRNNLK